MKENTAAIVEFGELPPAKSQKAIWPRITEALRARPGEWAKVRTLKTEATARSTASQVKRGVYGGMTKGDFEATSRGLDVWARYVGDQS